MLTAADLHREHDSGHDHNADPLHPTSAANQKERSILENLPAALPQSVLKGASFNKEINNLKKPT